MQLKFSVEISDHYLLKVKKMGGNDFILCSQGQPIARRGRAMSPGLKFLGAYIFFLCKVLY